MSRLQSSLYILRAKTGVLGVHAMKAVFYIHISNNAALSECFVSNPYEGSI